MWQIEAGVVKLVNTQDLKSCAFNGLRVQVPSPAPLKIPPRSMPEWISVYLDLSELPTARIQQWIDFHEN